MMSGVSGRIVKAVASVLEGPLGLRRERPGTTVLLLALLIGLAVLSPIGALVTWLSVSPLTRLTTRLGRFRLVSATAAFCAIYASIVLAVVPALARPFGRVPLPCVASEAEPLRPASLGYCLLGRNYVRAEHARIVRDIARQVGSERAGGVTVYLDAGFPFGGLPVLPHLSHHDGRKLDVAFRYRSRETDLPVTSGPSPIGYWVYEPPRSGESRPCAGREGSLRWNFRWLQRLRDRYELDEEATRDLIVAFAARSEVEKILVEPHLRERLGITSPKVRFQGCEAARHDDHFHVQFR